MSRGDHYFSYTCDICAKKTDSLRVRRGPAGGVEFRCEGCK